MRTVGVSKVNGYTIETRGGESFVKRWAVLQDEKLIAVYFKYREAKKRAKPAILAEG